MPSDELQQKDINVLTENLKKLEDSMKEGFSSINNRLDIMNDHFIRKDFFDEKITNMTQDIVELKDANKWLSRTVATIIIGAVLGGVLMFK